MLVEQRGRVPELFAREVNARHSGTALGEGGRILAAATAEFEDVFPLEIAQKRLVVDIVPAPVDPDRNVGGFLKLVARAFPARFHGAIHANVCCVRYYERLGDWKSTSRISNVVPPPSSAPSSSPPCSARLIDHLWASTMASTIARPKPVPSLEVV